MRLVACCSKMVNGCHKVGFAAVLTFLLCASLLRSSTATIQTYDLEEYTDLYREIILKKKCGVSHK